MWDKGLALSLDTPCPCESSRSSATREVHRGQASPVAELGLGLLYIRATMTIPLFDVLAGAFGGTGIQ